ncbi:hypothetical protein BT96DRAFT_956449 [Gymnopus androsaceus JB14]|uniref:Uncharacterized protein n=1 Tax=Gymnopus androsaceus JB14 TaxID=1447944 RepID=A0A6A4HY95_9AGAR|nr:hypothetical protein BT96DRAFT_956449 [Gymnopus androsaceus JB14]
MAPQSNSGFSFTGMVGATMGALKKGHLAGYNKVSTEEGRVTLPVHTPSGYQDKDLEEEEGLLNTRTMKRTIKRRWLNCGLFCKAIAIVVAIFFIISAGKLIMWAIGPAITGLEGMPVFSESLGCMDDASYLYNGGETTLSIPIGQRKDHSIDIGGSAVGTITVTEAAADIDEVQYKFTIRSNDMSMVDQIDLTYPGLKPGPDSTSRLVIGTPRYPRDSSSCVRYDVVMYIPRALKKLHVASHAACTCQIRSRGPPRSGGNNLRSTSLSLEVYRGWLVGQASIVNRTSIATQRGDGVMNVHVHPTAPADPENPSQVTLQTYSGAGRTDLFFENDKVFAHRPIKSLHTSAMRADVYLHYKAAEFDGNINLGSSSFTATGAKPYSAGGSWTHWVGDTDGKDEIIVKSKGWTGLYF